MPKTDTFQDLSLAPRNDDAGERWRWLYAELRAAILDGRLRRGARLPSTRNLARQYGLSRGTVTTAFDQLQAEGYTRAQTGSGTYVAPGLPDRSLAARNPRPPLPDLPPSRASLSRVGRDVLARVTILPAPRSVGSAFRGYEPAIDLFPVDLWARVASRVIRRAPRALYGHGDAAGYRPLRDAIAEYVGRSRGVRCSPEQVIVTCGAQQALDLVARLLVDPGDRVWMEDPGYPGAALALSAAGARIVAVPVDRDGLDVAAARARAPHAKLAYVTPAHQFPLGVTMSAERRLALLSWAAGANAWIVEDEYDAEYRYHGRPVAALHSLDRSGAVIYIGTFTKMLFNALRLGFMVVPERLVRVFESGRSLMDRHPPTLDQAILAEFIIDGHFGRHVRRMRQTYAERLSVLKKEARAHLGDALEIADTAAGMRTIGWLQPGASDRAVAQRAQALGLELAPLSAFTTEHAQAPGIILGFAGCCPAELRRGVRVLAAALRSTTR